MSRRKDSIDRDSLREKLIAVAEALVVQGGPEALTVRALAVHIGYSVGHVYNLVPDLDTLVLILNGRTLDRLLEALKTSMRRRKGEARLQALAEAYLDFCTQHAPLWALVLGHCPARGQKLPEAYLARMAALPALVQTELQALFPGCAADDLRQDVALLWAALHGLGALEANGRLALLQAAPAPQLAQRLLETWLAGMRRATQSSSLA